MKYNYDYFISYAHKDNQSEDGKPGFVDVFVDKLCKSEEHLRLFGKDMNVFFDKHNIKNMSDWDILIRSSLASSRFLIVLLSPNYFKSEYCAKEFDWWMKHEMHRCTLGEGTAPILILNVDNWQDNTVETIPAIPSDLQIRFPNWLKQLRRIQSDLKFDMHDLLISKIDDVLKTLRDEVKDKVRHQDMADDVPRGSKYPFYNENFVGRREKLLSLRDYISAKSGKVVSAIIGMGGFGKTELALTYGYAFGWDYQMGRFFMPCENCNSIYNAILTCGIMEMYGLKPEGTNEDQFQKIIKQLNAKQDEIVSKNSKDAILKTEGAHLLLILDNVKNQELISQLLKLDLPNYFHVIITMREKTTELTGVHWESVERLSEDESVELLSNLRPFGKDPKEAEAARKIAKLLAGFTLTVELTGSYLASNIDVPEITYQSQYKQLVNNLEHAFKKMADEIDDLTRHPVETMTAVLKSTLTAVSPNTRKALEFASLMVPDAVAMTWLPELCGLNEDDGITVLKELTRYSLLTPLENERNLAHIHRLVAEAVKQEIPEEIQKEMIAKILDKCEALLKKDKTFWHTSENSWNITPISEFCMAQAEKQTLNASENEIERMLWFSGPILMELGKLNELRSVIKRIIEITEKRVNSFHLNSDAKQKYLLGVYYISSTTDALTGDINAARMWNKKYLEITQQLAEQIPDDADAHNFLLSYQGFGIMEQIAGNIAAARTWYKKALDICLQQADKTPNDVYVQQNLSNLYNDLGFLEQSARKTSAARKWYKKALDIRQRLADKTPKDVKAQQSLSDSYEKLGDIETAAKNFADARMCLKKALKIHKWLANKKTDNYDVQIELSNVYASFGRLEATTKNIADAQEWYDKALKILKQLADKEPENFIVQWNLGDAYFWLGYKLEFFRNTDKAQEWLEKALEIYQKLLELMPESIIILRGIRGVYVYLAVIKGIEGLKTARVLLKKNDNPEKEAKSRFAVWNEKMDELIDSSSVWYEKALEIQKRLVKKLPDNYKEKISLIALRICTKCTKLKIKVNKGCACFILIIMVIILFFLIKWIFF